MEKPIKTKKIKALQYGSREGDRVEIENKVCVSKEFFKMWSLDSNVRVVNWFILESELVFAESRDCWPIE